MEKSKFLEGINNDVNHRVLLYEAIRLTTGLVAEFGSGHGSTPYLRKHCKDIARDFISFENNEEWANATGATLIDDWDKINIAPDVLFIDHAPGERRKEDIKKYANIAKIIVIHDTEPAADYGYQMRQHFDSFKYWVELETNGAWATMVSNFIDLKNTKGNNQYPITWRK